MPKPVGCAEVEMVIVCKLVGIGGICFANGYCRAREKVTKSVVTSAYEERVPVSPRPLSPLLPSGFLRRLTSDTAFAYE